VVLAKLLDGSLMYSQATLAVDGGSGHTVPVPSHGRTIYLTPEQVQRNSPLHWTSWLAYVFAAAAAVVEAKSRKASKRAAT
jgi:hypothetical protein